MNQQSQLSSAYVEQFRSDISRYAQLDEAEVRSQLSPGLDAREVMALGCSLASALDKTRSRARTMLEAHHMAFELSPVFCDVGLLEPLGQSRRELSVTQVLGWLLDPNGNHGFADLFLKALLNHLAAGSGAAEKLLGMESNRIKVFTEFALESFQRADIVVVGGRNALVIEAKVDAQERIDQTAGYAKYVNRKFENACFVFLAPPGVRPQSDEFLHLRYLELCRVMIQALSRGTFASGFHYARYFVAGLLKHMCGITTSSVLERVLSGDCIKIEMLLGGEPS